MSHRCRSRPAGPRHWLLLLVVAGLLAGCQTGPGATSATSTAAAGEQQPSPIRFSGRKATTTEPFLLAGGLTVFTGEQRGRGAFRVEVLNEEGEPQRVLFLSTGRYRGSTGLGLRGGIYRLAVAAGTPWAVEITQPRGQAGAALPQRYQGASDALVGPFRVDGDLRVEVGHEGQGDLTVELLSDQGPSLYFLIEDSGRFKTSRMAAGHQPGNYYHKLAKHRRHEEVFAIFGRDHDWGAQTYRTRRSLSPRAPDEADPAADVAAAAS